MGSAVRTDVVNWHGNDGVNAKTCSLEVVDWLGREGVRPTKIVSYLDGNPQ